MCNEIPLRGEARLREIYSAAIGNNALNDWNSIALRLVGRSNKDCRKRWAKICTNVKKGAWDEEEDKRLYAAVQRHGFWYVTPILLDTGTPCVSVRLSGFLF